jgi:hypothetical protein
MIEHLPNKGEAVSSNPSMAKKKEEEEEERGLGYPYA